MTEWTDPPEHVEVYATITDRWGRAETVYAGSQPLWAWRIDRCTAWRRMMRAHLLAERTTEPRGWRVVFTTPGLSPGTLDLSGERPDGERTT